eukprot:3931851-Rhodomonas_salina.1
MASHVTSGSAPLPSLIREAAQVSPYPMPGTTYHYHYYSHTVRCYRPPTRSPVLTFGTGSDVRYIAYPTLVSAYISATPPPVLTCRTALLPARFPWRPFLQNR